MPPTSSPPAAATMHNPYHWYEFGPNMRAPGLLRIALEWRAPWEYGAALLAQPFLAQAPHGDGHPVLIFPGLMASDTSTKPLRKFLESKGYAVAGWGLGSNLGPRDGVLDNCRKLLKDLRRQYKRKVSLVGWSLGGIYARELAKEFPEGRATGDHDGNAVHRAPEGDQRVAALRTRHRPSHRRAGNPRAAARAATGADHLDLQPQRRHRRLAVQRRKGRTLAREHRGRSQPLRSRAEPARVVGGR